MTNGFNDCLLIDFAMFSGRTNKLLPNGHLSRERLRVGFEHCCNLYVIFLRCDFIEEGIVLQSMGIGDGRA